MRAITPTTLSLLLVVTWFAGCERVELIEGSTDPDTLGGAAGDGESGRDGDLFADGDGDAIGDLDGAPIGTGGFLNLVFPGGSPAMGGMPSSTADYSDRVYTIEGCESETSGRGLGGTGSCEGVTFTVWDAHTDESLKSCRMLLGDVTITITGEAPLTLSADFCGDNIASAAFEHAGEKQGVHGVHPYGLSPDTNGDFDEATPALTPGVYELTAHGYPLTGGAGQPVESGSITVTVVDADAGAGGASN